MNMKSELRFPYIINVWNMCYCATFPLSPKAPVHNDILTVLISLLIASSVVQKAASVIPPALMRLLVCVFYSVQS